ncbi:MAG: DNA translocase FtsK [Coriobacteriia bacterium]|nr:DNA translocase FtsK [Coriobacteriia bacterium]
MTWAFVRLTGTIITGIILCALGLVGLAITGLSFSRLVESISDWIADVREEKAKKAVSTRSASQVPKTRAISGDRHKKATDPSDALGNLNEFDEDSRDQETIAVRPRALRDQKTVTRSDAETVAVNKSTIGPKALEGFELPSFDLLLKSAKADPAAEKEGHREARITADNIVDTLNTFDVPSRVVDWIAGPTVTLFKIEIAKGVRLHKITALDNELALALAAPTLRILAPIPGESLVGIEVPNSTRTSVTLGDVLPPAGTAGPLALAIGKDVAGKSIVRDLDKMPHLLIGGTTGSGKSVAINSMLMSMIMRATPSEVRFILIDPKRVEMTFYNDIPHLYVPVVTEPQEAAAALAWAVTEMERRLKVFQKLGVRDIGAYNEKLLAGEAGEDPENLPYLVVVIDELADLMMVAAKEVETSIVRIAQKARAAGIHLIVATQRPEATIVTGLIKSNITNRIAFNVGSSMDSRVILDQNGAEQLTGNGDMLYTTPAWPKPKRIQGCFISTQEIAAVVSMLKGQVKPEYHREILIAHSSENGQSKGSGALNDDYLWPAAEFVISAGLGSTSSIQRNFSVGYARAGRIMDTLTELGIVGLPDGSKPRKILVDFDGLDEIKRTILGDELEFEEEE